MQCGSLFALLLHSRGNIRHVIFLRASCACEQLLLDPLQIDYPEIVDGVIPRHRFMAAYEQKVEPPDRKWQYLLFAAEPYETIGFKV